MSKQEEGIQLIQEPKWGRVFIAGGVDWLKLGRKELKATPGAEDLQAPHALRALSNVKVTKIFSGPGANHAVAIDIHGNVHLIGRNYPSSVFGVSAEHIPSCPPTVEGALDDGSPYTFPYVHKVLAATLGGQTPTKIVSAACGRHHTLLLGSCGRVWAAGKNDDGRLGVKASSEEQEWVQVRGPWEKDDVKIVQVTAGLTFSLFLGSDGSIYTAGSHEHGQCGNGQTGSRLVKAGKSSFDYDDYPVQIKTFCPQKIVSISTGMNHSLALSDDGFIWGWGDAGYGRLGLGDQKDRLVPTIIPQFSGVNRLSRGRDIICGPACSIVVDAQGIYQIAGKWKLSGDGSSGSPYTFFKYIQDIASCRIIKAASGGNGHFLIIPSEQEGMTTAVAFGQQCSNGELGLGPGAPKNSTKPVEVEPLRGVNVFDIAAAAATTYWLATPEGTALQDLDRWPQEIDSEEECLICNNCNSETLLECEKCENPYHLTCLNPPLEEVPKGEWLCPPCAKEQDDPTFIPALPSCYAVSHTKSSAKGVKRKAVAEPAAKKSAIVKKKK